MLHWLIDWLDSFRLSTGLLGLIDRMGAWLILQLIDWFGWCVDYTGSIAVVELIKLIDLMDLLQSIRLNFHLPLFECFDLAWCVWICALVVLFDCLRLVWNRIDLDWFVCNSILFRCVNDLIVFEWLIEWFVDWFGCFLIVSLIGYLVDWLKCFHLICLIDWQVDLVLIRLDDQID